MTVDLNIVGEALLGVLRGCPLEEDRCFAPTLKVECLEPLPEGDIWSDPPLQ